MVISAAEVKDQSRYVKLEAFEPLDRIVRLADIRNHSSVIYQLRAKIQATWPDQKHLYLPFQFRSDGLRMMSNYFAKFPKELVKLFFEEPGVASELGEAEDLLPTFRPSRMAFLEPFRSKADLNYIVNVGGRTERRTRSHETLVNAFANWLFERGHAPARNRAIDIGLKHPSVIFEAKVIKNWSQSIRQAVGQLYEYRYFQVVQRDTILVFLASQPIPDRWRRYLEEDRGVYCAWFNGVDFMLSERAAKTLGH